MPQFPAVLTLSGLSAADGFKIIGGAPYSRVGAAISSAGDVNGDGFADLIIGQNSDGNSAGAAYVVYGKASGFGTINITTVTAGNGGFKIIGENARDNAGRAVSSAGDINGDGFADLFVAAYRNNVNNYERYGAGAAYVVYGSASGTDVNLDDVAQGGGGFKIIGEAARDDAGWSVAAAGDVNGDGVDDLILSAISNDDGGDGVGASYVVFGPGPGSGPVLLSDVAQGIGGFKIRSETGVIRLYAGQSVSSAGDINGDGFDDLIVGSHRTTTNGVYAGAAFVVFGGQSLTDVDLADVSQGTGGFKIVGEAFGDHAGRSVSSAGDINGDGFADLIVGAYGNDAAGNYSGAAYVVFGKSTPFSANVNLSDVAQGVGGFRIIGEGDLQLAGVRVSSAGDVNGDGFADVIIGAYGFYSGGGYATGSAYVVFGKASGFANVNLTDVAQGIGGFKILGEAQGDNAGSWVSSAGDVNGDGIDDLFVGAQGNAEGGRYSGAAYVIFGRAPDAPVVSDGTAGPDLLKGAGGNDTLRGLDGDDTLVGFGGNDTLDGGAGGDLMKGGEGDDTYIVDAGRDRVVELADAGDDHVFASINYVLGENIERLTLTGTRAINAIGNDLDNTITGNDAANVIDGGRGADIMIGGRGDDNYSIDDAGDQVIERSNGGFDTVIGFTDVTLGAFVENVALAGSDNLNATGNRLANIIVGNDGDNVLAGGLGNDLLQGNLGNDVFLFDTKLNAVRNVDQIVDFIPGEDMIHLDNAIFTNLGPEGALNPRMFAIGAPGDANDRLIYDDATGILSYDVDGNGAKAAVAFAQVCGCYQLTAADFLIV